MHGNYRHNNTFKKRRHIEVPMFSPGKRTGVEKEGKKKKKTENLESKHQTKGQLHHVIEFRFKSSFVFVFFF